MLPWKTIITINSQSKRSVYLQVSDGIIQEVNQGRISPGSKLPGSRQLAEELSLNRKTVQMAYDELLAQGYLEIQPARGTFIKSTLPDLKVKKLKDQGQGLIKHELSMSSKPQKVINDGSPDFRLAPVQQLYKHAQFIANSNLARSVMTGSHTCGEIHLRNVLSVYLHETRAIRAAPHNIMITRGSQMSIFLALSHLLNKGDRVMVGELNYAVANETLSMLDAVLVPVKLKKDGLDMGHIESYLKENSIKAIYLTPHHHYPTTVTMPAENRIRLLELASQHDFYILEDDYDYDYHYHRSPILPIASIDQEERVIYIGSFSKLLAPAFRIGYMTASAKMIDACAKMRLNIDRRGDPVIERALAMMIEENEIQRSLKKTVEIYRYRRDLFCSTLVNQLGNRVSFDIPDGGMAIWMNMHGVKTTKLIEEAYQANLMLDIGIYALEDHCRLGFASINEEEIADYLSILCECFLKQKN